MDHPRDPGMNQQRTIPAFSTEFLIMKAVQFSDDRTDLSPITFDPKSERHFRAVVFH